MGRLASQAAAGGLLVAGWAVVFVGRSCGGLLGRECLQVGPMMVSGGSRVKYGSLGHGRVGYCLDRHLATGPTVLDRGLTCWASGFDPVRPGSDRSFFLRPFPCSMFPTDFLSPLHDVSDTFLILFLSPSLILSSMNFRGL